MRPPEALYVHVPFCLGKCRYCDFYSLPLDAAAAGLYVGGALAELSAAAGCLRTPLASAYVGGGTPTVLPPPLLKALLSAVGTLADERTEFSVEANPGSLDLSVASVLADSGVNRVTLGAQSFRQEELDTLGRRHTPAQVPAAVKALREAGIADIGLDLMYGIPGQTSDTWRDTLRTALGMEPAHLSCYALSFEENTPLHEDLNRGLLQPVDEWVQRRCHDAAIEAAGRAGLEHYEISNFARPGRRCRHNMTYWRNLPYLGIGPGAASYIQGQRRTNRADLGAYVQAVRAGKPPPCTSERLADRMAMAETLMLGLRLTEGVDRREFAARFARDPVEAFPASMRRHAQLGSILLTDRSVRISRSHLFVADAVLADILAEAEG